MKPQRELETQERRFCGWH